METKRRIGKLYWASALRATHRLTYTLPLNSSATPRVARARRPLLRPCPSFCLHRLRVVPISSVIPSATSKKLSIKDFFSGQVVRGQEEWLPVPQDSPSLAVSGYAQSSRYTQPHPVSLPALEPRVRRQVVSHPLQCRLQSCGRQFAPSRPCLTESAGSRSKRDVCAASSGV